MKPELPQYLNVHTFKGHKGAQERLNTLHDYYDLSWPQIATLVEYQTVPFSTLARFPGVGAVDNRNRVTINADDLDSAPGK